MASKIRIILGILGFFLLLALLWYIKVVIVYLIIGAVLALLGRPIVKLLDKIKLGKYKIPSAVSALITLLLILGIFVGLFSLFIPIVAREARIISSIDLQQVSQSLEEPLNEVSNWLQKYKLTAENETGKEFMQNKLKEVFGLANVSAILQNLVGILGNVFAAIFSILFITFFFLKEPQLIYRIILTLTPDNQTTKMMRIIKNTKDLLTRYFAGVLLQVTLVSNLIIFGLNFLSVQNAILIGFFAGLLNIIPYVGPLLGASFAILITTTTNLDMDFYNELLPLLGKMAIIFAIVQLMDNLLFQPLIFSNSVNAHPLEIFLIIIIAGTLAGITGMILAIPVYSILRIIAKEFLSEYKIVQSLTKNI